jgi:hypothetical protein
LQSAISAAHHHGFSSKFIDTTVQKFIMNNGATRIIPIHPLKLSVSHTKANISV